MDIKIDGIEIKEDSFKAIVEVQGMVGRSYGNGRDYIEEKVIKAVVEAATKKYLAENLHTLMSEIDKQQILNMIVLSSAKSVRGQAE